MRIDPRRLSRPERILWGYGIDEPCDIDLEAIAYGLGAVVKTRSLEGCDARLVRSDTKAIITVNSRNSPSRRRFSIAHELGHLVEDSRRQGFQCVKADISPQNAEAKTVEALANLFASQLILPTYLFVPKLEGKSISLDTADDLSKDFNASLTATAIKLVKHASTPAILICHSQTGREWFVRNLAFPSDIWPQMELHFETAGFEMLFGSAAGKSRIMSEPALRWLTGRDIFQQIVRAQSIRLSYGIVLSLVSIVK